MIEDLIKQKEEIEAKIDELRKAEPVYQSFERIRKFKDLIGATYNLIAIEYKNNPFIQQMERYGYKTDSDLFPYKLAFKHKSEDSSFYFILKTKEIEDVIGIDDAKLKTLKSFLQGKF